MSTDTNQSSSASTGGTASGTLPSGAPVVARLGFRMELQQMLQGFQAVVPANASVTTSAGNQAQADLVAQLQEYVGSYLALDAQAIAHQKAHQLVKTQLGAAKQLHAMLKLAVLNQFGPGSPMLAQFGLRPKRAPRARSTEQLAVQAAKAKATRKLRQTMGAVQKASIKAGPMQFVEPVANTGQPQPLAAGAVSPPTAK